MDGGGTTSYVDLAIEDDVDGGATTPPPPPPPQQQPPEVAVAVVLAISRRLGPRVSRPKRRRAVVPGAVGSDHGARRTKEFMQWREWYLREKRREREAARWYHIGIPPQA